jgi:DNA-binding transcriptional MerR regulator
LTISIKSVSIFVMAIPQALENLEMQRDTIYTLEEFETACNTWLAQYLPETYQGTRAREPISIRNLRHYASEGLIDEPLKQGREARYSYRHLVQVLLLRRAMAEGYTTKLLYGMMRRATIELEALLSGDLPASPNKLERFRSIQPAVSEESSNQQAQREVLDYLNSLKPQSNVIQSQISNSAPLETTPAQSWQQFEIAPGIELWLRSDALLPKTALERQRLISRIEPLLR